MLYPAPASAAEVIQLTFAGTTPLDTMRTCISVSMNDFARFYPGFKNDWGDQFSLTITDYAYADRVIDALEELGYGAVSPYRQCSTQQDPELASQRLQTLIICLAVMVVVLVLQVLVLRAMFTLQIETYKTLSNIGLDCKTARRSVFWQMLLMMIPGQLLAALCIALCRRMEVERIMAVLRYITAPGAAAILAVHTAATVLAACWVMSALRKQVYPFAATEYDLDLGTEVDA